MFTHASLLLLTPLFCLVLRAFLQRGKLLRESFEILLRQFFAIVEMVARTAQGADEFVELEMHGFGVAILCALDEEDHDEGDDGRAGVDDELPSVGEMEQRPGESPHHYDPERG